MLLRHHLDDDVVELSQDWFDHVLRFSRRDQLAFNYVAWRRGFPYSHFSGELTANDWMTWPVGHGFRFPHDFRDDVYVWLNPVVARSRLSPRRHYRAFGAHRRLGYALHKWELDRLANKYRSDKGSLYYNGHAYAAIYETYLRDKREDEIHVLELGLLRHDVQARNPGGPYDDTPSLKMWREYLPKARLVGFDIADFSTAPQLPGVRILRGDVGRADDLRRLVAETGGEFDVIIDDASHASHHQQTALAWLFPHLKAGGYYFIEDLSYQPPELEKRDAVKTRDLLKSLSRGEEPVTPFMEAEQVRYLRDHVDFIRFYDSWDRHFGHVLDDALAVIRRQGSRYAPETLREPSGPLPEGHT